jgi:gas vesicle protein
MVNQNYEHENDAHEPGGSLAGLLAGLLIGLLIGGLTGAVTMLLVAPQSGKRTRAKIHRQSAEWREQAADTMGDAMASAGDKARQITHDVSNAG